MPATKTTAKESNRPQRFADNRMQVSDAIDAGRLWGKLALLS
jgi:hypothetical protein